MPSLIVVGKKEGELESFIARAQGELGKREAALRVVNS